MDATVDTSFRVRFRNNSALVSFIDHPMMHSPHWISVIENVVGRPLKSWAGIIFGAIQNSVGSMGGEVTVPSTTPLGDVANSSNIRTTAPTLYDIVHIYKDL